MKFSGVSFLFEYFFSGIGFENSQNLLFEYFLVVLVYEIVLDSS